MPACPMKKPLLKVSTFAAVLFGIGIFSGLFLFEPFLQPVFITGAEAVTDQNARENVSKYLYDRLVPPRSFA